MVTIENSQFNPSTVTVNVGTMVMWANREGTSHRIVSDTGSPQAFSSDTLLDGAYFRFTFTRPGIYPYHCSIHPSVNGTVIVLP